MKRIIALSVLGSMLAGLMSCGSDASENENNTTAVDSAVSEESDAGGDGFIPDNLPEDLDFGGQTVTILGWNHYEDIEFEAEELTGDVVNDAYYYRNLAVEDRLNVKLEFQIETARGDSDDTFLPLLQNSVLSGSGSYDIAAAHSHRMSSAAASGLLANLLNVDYIDFDMPWWRQSLISETTLNGALFFAAGDISVSSLTRMQGIFFNNQLIVDFGLEDPYDLVLSGDWTLDKMEEMTKGLYLDLNGNNTKDEADRFGFCSDWVQLQAVYYTSGLRAVVHNESGGLELSELINSDRSIGVIEKMQNILHSSNDNTTIKVTDDDTIFREGRALFYAFPLGIISSSGFREADFEIGFVPWPKYDAGDNYITNLSNAYSIWSIPLDAKDADMSGAVMEAMASEGYRTITPAIFETAYKVKYNNIDSQRQSEIFDMMREDMVFDIGRLFAYQFQFLTNEFANTIYNNRNDWSSRFESNRSSLEAAIDELEETFSSFSEN